MKSEHYPAEKLKQITKDPLFWSSLVLIVVIGVLINNFEFNFGAIRAEISTIMGEGTPGFAAKWVNGSIIPVSTPTLVVLPNSAVKNVGGAQQFTATYDPDGSDPQPAQNVTNSAAWTSANVLIATINSSGLATGVTVGNTQINVSYNGLSTSANITIQAPANNPPTASSLNAQVSGTGNSLSNDCKINDAIRFNWNYSDLDNDAQAAFQIQVSLTNNFASPVYDSTKQNSSANSFIVNTLAANAYYWRLKVWDSRGAESQWISGQQFTISSQKAVDFSWTPANVFVNQSVVFTPQTSIQISSYNWTFTGGSPSASSVQAPSSVQFTSIGPKNIVLNIFTNNSQTCSVSKTLVVGGGGEI